MRQYFYPYEVVKTPDGRALRRSVAFDGCTCCQCNKAWPCDCPSTEAEHKQRTDNFIAQHEAGRKAWSKYWDENPRW